MPRKRQSAAAADEDVEQRVTRRSLRTRAPATPKKEESEEEEEVATPSKSRYCLSYVLCINKGGYMQLRRDMEMEQILTFISLIIFFCVGFSFKI